MLQKFGMPYSALLFFLPSRYFSHGVRSQQTIWLRILQADRIKFNGWRFTNNIATMLLSHCNYVVHKRCYSNFEWKLFTISRKDFRIDAAYRFSVMPTFRKHCSLHCTFYCLIVRSFVRVERNTTERNFIVLIRILLFLWQKWTRNNSQGSCTNITTIFQENQLD